eukprot:gene2339-17976_t
MPLRYILIPATILSSGGSMECLDMMTSDGESPRSESPDSITSTNSEGTESKGGRRIRTMIQSWQKNCLETVFENQQYPTVYQCEELSKKLGLPNYVTKVWFQNRRSKFRKEGSRKQVRNSIDPYPVRVKNDSLITKEETPLIRNIPVENDRKKSQNNEQWVGKQKEACNCPECINTHASIALNASKVDVPDRQIPESMPKLEICNCRDCIARTVVYRQQQQQHSELQSQFTGFNEEQREMARDVDMKTVLREENERQKELENIQERDALCGCSQCHAALQRAKNEEMYFKTTVARYHSSEQYYRPSRETIFHERNFEDKFTKTHGTLHYVPPKLDLMYDRVQAGQCFCKECTSNSSHFK